MIVEGEHHTERDNLELNFSVSFVESNIKFKLEDRESYVPPVKGALRFNMNDDREIYTRFNTCNDPNFMQKKELGGVSRGDNLKAIPNFNNRSQGPQYFDQRMITEEDDDDGLHGNRNKGPGFWEQVGDALGKGIDATADVLGKGWDYTVIGTVAGWEATKEGWNKMTDSLVDVRPRVFGSCGCVDNVDTRGQDDSSSYYRSSNGSANP